MTLSVIMLALLMVCTLHSDHWPVTIGLAAAGMLIVTGRFALTLRLNPAVLQLARTEATTDALTGLGNRRQLAADLQSTLGRWPPSAVSSQRRSTGQRRRTGWAEMSSAR